VEVTTEMAKGRSDLKPYIGKKLNVIAWIWARTVKSPDPAFAHIDVPLASTFMLSTKVGKETYVEPSIDGDRYQFVVREGKPKDAAAAKNGTKLARGANFKCLVSGSPIAGDYIKNEGMCGRIGARLMAIVAECNGKRVYLSPADDAQQVALTVAPEWKPEVVISGSTQYLGVKPYGMAQFWQLFTARQLVAMTTLSDLVQGVRKKVLSDAANAGFDDGHVGGLEDRGVNAGTYADAVATYIAFSLSKVADYNCTLVPWYTKEDRPGHLFSKQAIPMVWDYAELNLFSDIGGGLTASIGIIADALSGCNYRDVPGHAIQLDAVAIPSDSIVLFSTDPPYYDNVPYADLSDFFYVWLRRSLKPVFPDLFTTLATPKAEELVAFAYRHNGKSEAKAFFLDGISRVMHRLAEQAHPGFPVQSTMRLNRRRATAPRELRAQDGRRFSML
jgi:putative DNA methylase